MRWKGICAGLAPGNAAGLAQGGVRAQGTDRRAEMLMPAKVNRFCLDLISKLPTLDGAELIWSMWTGYLQEDDRMLRFCAEHDLELRKVHSSGHATVQDLKRLAQALQARQLIPIHTFHPDDYGQFGVPVRQLNDGEVLTL